MIRSNSIILMLLSAATIIFTGCAETAVNSAATTYQATFMEASLPRPPGDEVRNVQLTSDRKDPWSRLAELDSTYRNPDGVVYLNVGGQNDTQSRGKSVDTQGTDASLFDNARNHRIYIARMYVLVGSDFLAEGDTGAASQAYWASLHVASVAPALRVEREQVKTVAYEELTNIAERRNQKTWSQMLTSCRDYARLYLVSDDAKKEQQLVEAHEKAIETARTKLIDRKQTADNNKVIHKVLFFTSMAGYLGASLSGSSAADYLSPAMFGLAETVDADNARISAEEKAYQAALKALELEESSRAWVPPADDTMILDAGQSFFAEESVYYLTHANEQDRFAYVEVLERLAADRPSVKVALANYSSVKDDVGRQRALVPLANSLREMELFAARHERQGQAPE